MARPKNYVLSGGNVEGDVLMVSRLLPGLMSPERLQHSSEYTQAMDELHQRMIDKGWVEGDMTRRAFKPKRDVEIEMIVDTDLDKNQPTLFIAAHTAIGRSLFVKKS